MHRLTGWIILTVCCTWLFAGGLARAAESEEPETLIQQAIELRRKGDNARAYGYLKRAYDLARTPRSAAQLGLVEHALGRWAEAEVHLGEALATSDPWVESNRARLSSSRAFVRSKLGRVEIGGAPADATVSVGTDGPIKIPADRVVYLAPGERTLRIEAPGIASVTKTVSVTAGQTATVTIEAVASKDTSGAQAAGGGVAAAGSAVTPAAGGSSAAGEPRSPDAGSGTPTIAATAAPATPDGSGGRAGRIAGLGIAGGGLALGVAGIFVRGVATSKLDAIARDAKNVDAYNESNGNWQTFDRAGVAMMVAGCAAVVGGTILYLVSRSSSEPSNVAVGFVPAAGGGGMTFAGRF